MKILEHASIPHIMPVYNSIRICKIFGISAFCVNAASKSVALIHIMVQIKQIICCTLSDRIINIRVRNTDPGIQFIIYGSEFSKVDRISQT